MKTYYCCEYCNELFSTVENCGACELKCEVQAVAQEKKDAEIKLFETYDSFSEQKKDYIKRCGKEHDVNWFDDLLNNRFGKEEKA